MRNVEEERMNDCGGELGAKAVSVKMHLFLMQWRRTKAVNPILLLLPFLLLKYSYYAF